MFSRQLRMPCGSYCLLALWLATVPALGDFYAEGDVWPDPDLFNLTPFNPFNWNSDGAQGEVYVGQGWPGKLYIGFIDASTAGEPTTLNSRVGVLGLNTRRDEPPQWPGGEGFAIVHGAWNVTEELDVGFEGVGNLTILGGSSVTANHANIGLWPSGTGIINVIGDFTTTFFINVGTHGHGTLQIGPAGNVLSDSAWVGALAGSVGQATMQGDAAWNVTSYLGVGHGGLGTLDMEGTGPPAAGTSPTLNAGWASIGETASGHGTASLSNGSVWNIGSSLAVGNEGHGALTVETFSRVKPGWMEVARRKTGQLMVQGGGEVIVAGPLTLGLEQGSQATVTVQQGGSRLTAGTPENPWGVNVGNSGGALLSVNLGGLVSAQGDFNIAVNPTSQATVNINALGTVQVGQTAVVGGWWAARGGQGILNINPGGTLNVTGTLMGWETGHMNLTDGTINAGSINLDTVGAAGFGTLTVGGESEVHSGWLAVGHLKQGNLTVANGGLVAVEIFAGVANEAGSMGAVTVTGNESKLSAGWMNVATLGPAGLDVSNGALVEVGGYLGIGNRNAGTLKLENAALKTGFATLGEHVTEGVFSHGTGLISNNSVWTNTDGLGIGNEGRGDLTITSGSTLNTGWLGVGTKYIGTISILGGSTVNTSSFILGGPGGNASALVSGPGTKLNANAWLEVGREGQGQMLVEQGAEVSVAEILFLGSAPGSHGALTITGENSKMTSLRQLSLALGASSELTVSASGFLETRKAASATGSSALVGRSEGTTGVATITGAGTKWVQDGALNVGFRGIGLMTVDDGANVHSAEGVVARFDTSSGTATVTGNGSLWQIDNILHVGGSPDGAGGAGTINVLEGGEVRVGNMLNLWSGGAVGGDGLLTASVANAGLVEPGASPGTLTINGNYAQSAEGTLRIELAGPDSLDKLVVGASAALDGRLDIQRLNGFSPQPGQTLVVLTAASRSGTFSRVTGMSAGAGLVFRPDYRSDHVALVIGTPAAADFDADGDVDGADYVLFAGCAAGPELPYPPGCGLPPDANGHIAADLDHDGDADGEDFGAIQRCWSGADVPADPACAD